MKESSEFQTHYCICNVCVYRDTDCDKVGSAHSYFDWGNHQWVDDEPCDRFSYR
jgi:hypothetical protein